MLVEVLDEFLKCAKNSKILGLSSMDPLLLHRIVSLAAILMSPCPANRLYLVLFGPKGGMRSRSKSTRGISRGVRSASVEENLPDADVVIKENQRTFCMIKEGSSEVVDFVAEERGGQKPLKDLKFGDYEHVLQCHGQRWVTETALSPGTWYPAAKCAAGELGAFFCEKKMDYVLCTLHQLWMISRNANFEQAWCGWFLNEQIGTGGAADGRMDYHGVCTMDPCNMDTTPYQVGVYPDVMQGINIVNVDISFEYDDDGEAIGIVPPSNAVPSNQGVKTLAATNLDVDYLLPHGVSMILELDIKLEPSTGAVIAYET